MTLASKVQAGDDTPIVELLLRQGEMSCGQLAAALGMSPITLKPLLTRFAASDDSEVIEHEPNWYSLDIYPEAA